MALIYVIGIGLSGKASLSRRALELIERAGLVVGGGRHLDELPDIQARKVRIKGGLEKTARAIEGFLKGAVLSKNGRGRSAPVIVLATGDPSLYGIADFIVKRFGGRSVEIVPNVSVVQEAFARIKVNMQGLRVISAHARPLDSGFFDDIRSAGKAAIFTDSVNTPEKIADALARKGFLGCTAYVCSELGTPAEAVAKGTLASIARGGPYPALNTMLIIRDRDTPAPARRGAARTPGIPDNEFVSSTGMITKEEVRVVALSKLRLKEDSVVWDIGSGSGSVAVEAALVSCLGVVYAIEKNKTRVRDMEENKSRFGVSNLVIIEGAAPEGLASIEAPDAVFIGGGGTERVLSYAARRIKKGGRVVVNAVTMETASAAYGFLKKKGWAKELVLVSVSRAKCVKGLSILSAGNPVFIISGERP